MKIAASKLELSSTHVAVSQHEVGERLRAWIGPPPDAAPAASVALSEAGKARQAAEANATVPVPDDPVDSDPRLMLLRTIVEILTGRRIEVVDAGDFAAAPDVPALTDPNHAESALPPNFGVEYDRRETLVERETTTFKAAGTVRTADGRELSFSLDVTMQREYREESELSLRLGNARRKDPLVVNFAGNAAELDAQRFRLDLDGDGRAEDAHFVGAGSAFLVFDRNGDGKVNGGNELFGPTSGDGYGELAALDADGNGWIDGADPVYAQLRLWTRDDAGRDRLQSLADAGIGALGVDAVTTPFELRDTQNRSLGGVRETGVYLQEDGTAGSVQQVDLSV